MCVCRNRVGGAVGAVVKSLFLYGARGAMCFSEGSHRGTGLC